MQGHCDVLRGTAWHCQAFTGVRGNDLSEALCGSAVGQWGPWDTAVCGVRYTLNGVTSWTYCSSRIRQFETWI